MRETEFLFEVYCYIPHLSCFLIFPECVSGKKTKKQNFSDFLSMLIFVQFSVRHYLNYTI